MSFSLTILGSSAALPTTRRNPTAHVLNANERFFLIDCGEGTQLQLRRYSVRFGKINHIFISHIHGDHVFGLFGIISTFALLDRKSDLHIYGCAELHDMLMDHLKYFNRDLSFEIKFHTIGARRPAKIFEDDRITVTTIPLKHRIPTCGFLFREKPYERNIKKSALAEYRIPLKDIPGIKQGKDLITREGKKIPNEEITLPPYGQRSYAYCSDTAVDFSLADQLENVDLLYHEATFCNDDVEVAHSTLHSTSGEAAELACLAGVKKLVMGHFSNRYKDVGFMVQEARKIFPESYAAEDGAVFEVEQEREE